jgi:hypothetical protein
MHHQVNSDGLTASLESSVDIVHTTSPTPSASAPSPLPQRPPRRPAPRRPAPQPPMQPLGLGITGKYFSVLHFYYSDSPLTLGTSANFISFPFFLLCFHFFPSSTVHSSIFLRLLNLKTLCTHCVCSFFTSRLHTSAI